MRQPHCLLTVLLAIILLAGSAGMASAREQIQPLVTAEWANLDLNADGVIDRSEWSELKKIQAPTQGGTCTRRSEARGLPGIVFASSTLKSPQSPDTPRSSLLQNVNGTGCSVCDCSAGGYFLMDGCCGTCYVSWSYQEFDCETNELLYEYYNSRYYWRCPYWSYEDACCAHCQTACACC